jgi:hypothetical protein
MSASSHRSAFLSPLGKVDDTLWLADAKHVRHPLECIDLLCVANLATWAVQKSTGLNPKMPEWAEGFDSGHFSKAAATTTYMRYVRPYEMDIFCAPVGVLLRNLYSKLAWRFADMRSLEEYFRFTNLDRGGIGRVREWDSHPCFSAKLSFP